MRKHARLLRWSERAYSWLLRAYPEGYRRDFGPAMAETFRDLCRATLRERGIYGLLIVWLAMLTDTASNAVRERGGYMATLKQLFTAKLSSDTADRKFGQCVYFVASPLLYYIAIRRLTDLGANESEMLMGLLVAGVIALVLLVCGVILLEQRHSMPALRRALTRAAFARKYGQLLLFALCPAAMVVSVHKLGQLPLTEVQLLTGLLAASAFSFLLLMLGLLIGPAHEHAAVAQ